MGWMNTDPLNPESCGGTRKDVAEALTGEDAGEPLSRENFQFGLSTQSDYAEGETGLSALVSESPRPRGR